MTEVSKSQIDRLGQRLVGTPTADDLQFLATYRQSFQGPLKEVGVNGQPDLPIDGHETSPVAAKEFPTGGQKMPPRMAKQPPHRWPAELPTGG
jgi:hypothetical protein